MSHDKLESRLVTYLLGTTHTKNALHHAQVSTAVDQPLQLSCAQSIAYPRVYERVGTPVPLTCTRRTILG